MQRTPHGQEACRKDEVKDHGQRFDAGPSRLGAVSLHAAGARRQSVPAVLYAGRYGDRRPHAGRKRAGRRRLHQHHHLSCAVLHPRLHRRLRHLSRAALRRKGRGWDAAQRGDFVAAVAVFHHRADAGRLPAGAPDSLLDADPAGHLRRRLHLSFPDPAGHGRDNLLQHRLQSPARAGRQQNAADLPGDFVAGQRGLSCSSCRRAWALWALPGPQCSASCSPHLLAH